MLVSIFSKNVPVRACTIYISNTQISYLLNLVSDPRGLAMFLPVGSVPKQNVLFESQKSSRIGRQSVRNSSAYRKVQKVDPFILDITYTDP
jgi:hypothetical protein